MRPGIILPESEGFVTGCIRITRVESRGAKRTQAVHESKDSLRAGESDNYWKRARSLTQLTVRERKEAEGEPQQSLVAMGSKGDDFLDELWGSQPSQCRRGARMATRSVAKVARVTRVSAASPSSARLLRLRLPHPSRSRQHGQGHRRRKTAAGLVLASLALASQSRATA